jgi:hypothetical protein
MDTSAISTRLMKLLGDIGTNEPIDSILPTVASVIDQVTLICDKAAQLDIYKHHLASEAAALSAKEHQMSEGDKRLQELVDNVYARYKQVHQENI